MKTTLSREHRKILETTVAQARVHAEAGAGKTLKALAVAAKDAPAHASEEQKKLRVRLRAHGRALGDLLRPDDTQAIAHLVTEIAYEHWHRMLFARFLAESDLLMHPDGYPVSLADCKEDAETFDPPARSEWEVAGHYASAMLPNVFRPDSPALALQLPLETEQALEALLAKFPATVFQADDSLGWSYQFWQAPKKEEVQRQMKQAGTKVGADELPAVTQLFTEQYMVAFLLENTLGGWWHSRHPRMKLPVEMPYLRFSPSPLAGEGRGEGEPAAGTFPAWPNTLAQFKLLDPCAGSGHFLVSAFHYLVPMRRATEKLPVRDAIDKVLADNLHGLELDARCVEIAAFALALAAWRYPDENGNPIGYRPLPRLNIACVGVAPRSKKADWLKLAGGDERLEGGMAALYALFQKAPELGSLIDPMAATRGDLLDAHWVELESRLEQALAQKGDEQEIEARVAAQGMVQASRILTRKYHLVITNPPYLGAGQHGPVLKDFCEEHYKAAKGDLANVFLDRSFKLCAPGGAVSFVMPQNWLFLKSYQKQREHLLKFATWNLLARLGAGAFETITGEVVNAILLTLTHARPIEEQTLRGIDASTERTPSDKSNFLVVGLVVEVSQHEQLSHPESMVKLHSHVECVRLGQLTILAEGLSRGDAERYDRCFFELATLENGWSWILNPPIQDAEPFAGREYVFLWEEGTGSLASNPSARVQGQATWNRPGVFIARAKNLKSTLTSGLIHAQNGVAIAPRNKEDLPALWAYCSSPSFNEEVRKLNSKILIPTGVLGLVPFDLAHWQKVAAERYPNGLPKPYSDDPTQWIFHGHPKPATDPLQVAVARLLGYRWPAESDAEMELSDEARAWIARCKDLDGLIDDDGIVCLPAVRGEPAAVDRLRVLLAKAFGGDWSAARESQLLRDAGCDGLPLAQWLRDKFFEQHVARFQKRPFVWHVWDGHKEGFSALVNYHLLTREKLNTLINLYLGDWITQQKRAVDAGNSDATLKLAKAEALKAQLEAILAGDPPYDIFVRWKPLHQQPLGWDPDINDGVRMNIRPFVEAGVLRIPRAKIGIKWEADRGKDVASAPVAILWTDEKREWEAVLPRIKEALPELFSLGGYAPDDRTGPGVWLRMVADGKAAKVGAGETAILYLPGVGNGQLRTDLRGLKDDPQLSPLAELQYRGCFWRQENGKDWTLRAFLESKRGGLGLKVSASQETAQALKAAMGKLLMQNLPALDAVTIDERYLNDLINPAPDETVLRWLTAPEAIQAEKESAWESFVTTTRTRFAVDLGKGPVDVAQRILASKPGDATHPLWEKYCAHWMSYPDAYEVFRVIAPPDLFQGAERYPRENDADEKRLADELIKAATQEPVSAARAVLALEAKHSARRMTLWAKQGHAPLAVALADLAIVANAFLEPFAGANALDAAKRYSESGWRVDAAARAAIATAQQAELEKPIYAVLEALYRRWLEKQAEGFQALVRKDGYPHWSLPDVPEGTVVLFVDGLRLDLARELEVLLHADNGLDVVLEPGFTSIPSVTSSGKVWVSPAAKLAQGGDGGDFSPKLPKGAYTADKLRKAMEPEGYTVADTENPSFAYGKGWAEFPGDIDSDGHNKGLKLARAVAAHLDDMAKTIRRLLNAGWKNVWVVTDHGWLLLPGGLPKAELPAKLTETKWGRCAVLKDAAADSHWLVLPWSFDPAVRVALAPGISAFSSGREYDHGGLSLQESVVPFVKVSRTGPVIGQPRLVSVAWNTRKTICSVVANDAAGLTVALERLSATIGEAATLDAEGKGRVVFEEVDDLIGEQISVVLRREGQKVVEERMNFGEAWNGT